MMWLGRNGGGLSVHSQASILGRGNTVGPLAASAADKTTVQCRQIEG